MKKISIYWKTIGISISIILITVSVLFLLLSILAPTLTQKIQEDDFNSKVQDIVAEIEKNGIQKDVLDAYNKTGILVMIHIDGILEYPLYELELTIYQSETVYDDNPYGEYENNQYYLFTSGHITHNGTNYEVTIMKYISFSVSDSYLLIRSIFPYFLLVGVVVSFILSITYARFFTHKVSHLTQVTKQMKRKEYGVRKEKIEGDELQLLENDISSLYEQLMNEIQIVKKLEEERQLFLRGVTHELKTPIMTMGVTLEGILAGVEGYKNMQDSLYECYQELLAMSNLVNEILDIAKIETIKDIGLVSMKELVLDTLNSYQCLIADKSIMVIKQLDDDMELSIPQNHARKVISNLVNNAIKYTPPNKQFIITFQNNELCLINDMYDNAKLDINKIFDAFVTYNDGDEIFQNSHGLGLYIIASILNQYNISYSCFIENNQFHFNIQI